MFIGRARYVVASIIFAVGTSGWDWGIGVQATVVFLITEFLFQGILT